MNQNQNQNQNQMNNQMPQNQMPQNLNSNVPQNNNDVFQHSSGIRNLQGGSWQGGFGPYNRTPANYAGGSGPNQNQNITLYAQDGSTKQCETNDNGELKFEDTQWLNSHGGALPLNQVPQQDKACIRQSSSSVEARRAGNLNSGGGGGFGFGGNNENNQNNNNSGFGGGSNINNIEQRKTITLYAQDGSTKQCETNEHGELSLEDTQWLNSHGGALPLNQVPQQDKACIRQSASSVEARRIGSSGGAQSNF